MDAIKRASKIARDAVSATSIIPENAQRTPDQRFIGSTSDFVHLKGDGAKWSRLIASGQEATDISQALSHSNYGPVRTYVWDDALEDAFKQVRSPRILHVSTHGFFVQDQPDSPLDRNPFIDPNNAAAVGRARLGTVGKEDPLLRSGLVLAGANMLGEKIDQASKIDDGWVTAEEISMMQLQGTELVVLSACDTGLGDVRVGEGVYGLRRAFQNAGAASIIQTLFKVPDEQSQQMMKMFYQGLKAGRGKLAALHNAQLEIIRQRRARGGAAHPFFWAGFVVTGEAN